VYLIDTNVVSELRKGAKAHPGVAAFFKQLKTGSEPAYLSAITVGELRRGVELILHRGDVPHAGRAQVGPGPKALEAPAQRGQ
jgi:predicted nucleic acid-binding protein